MRRGVLETVGGVVAMVLPALNSFSPVQVVDSWMLQLCLASGCCSPVGQAFSAPVPHISCD